MPPETLLLVDPMPQKSIKFEIMLDCHPLAPSQVSGDSASLHPQATTPAAGAGVVGVQARRSEA